MKEKFTSGHLYQFIEKNNRMSEAACKDCFECVYKNQISSGKVSLQNLEISYNKQARGPSRDSTFERLYFEIPGPPVALAIHSEADQGVTVSWKEPTLHPTVIDLYCVQWYRKVQEDSVYGGCKYLLPNLKAKTVYTIRVCGKNNNRRGEYSEEMIFETKPGKPDKPRNANYYSKN